MTLSQAITLPFATTAQAQDTPIPKDANGETVRHSACLVNCGSQCPLKVIVK
ncbi:dimethyl sulfoxide reductase subunit A, partial [Pectobacterium atrosepticum]|nr:dimethyl sulfoxide reductase subunit A [Pectobacterium atrosepticum]